MRSGAMLVWSLGVAIFAAPAGAAPREIVLEVAGMSCPACPYIAEQALERVAGVEEAEVSYERKTARVVFDDAVTTAEELSAATAALGYPSKLRESGS